MRWLFLVGSLLLLTGCSVSIDPATDEEKQEQEQEQVEAQEQELQSNEVNQSIVEEEVQQEAELSIIDKIGQFFSSDSHSVKYLALGDSLTRGVGDESEQYGFTGRLSNELQNWSKIDEVQLDNRGKNGRRSDQLLKLVARGHYDEQLKKVDLITISLGGNDVMKVVKSDMFNLHPEMFDEALPGFDERYREIVTYIRQVNPDVPIVMVGFYNPFSIITDETEQFDEILVKWNAVIEQIAVDDTNACYVDVADLFDSNEDLVYHTDFFHPNANGYDRMAARVIEQMKQCDIEQMSNGLIGFEE